jgi:hypothetical protein
VLSGAASVSPFGSPEDAFLLAVPAFVRSVPCFFRGHGTAAYRVCMLPLFIAAEECLPSSYLCSGSHPQASRRIARFVPRWAGPPGIPFPLTGSGSWDVQLQLFTRLQSRGHWVSVDPCRLRPDRAPLKLLPRFRVPTSSVSGACPDFPAAWAGPSGSFSPRGFRGSGRPTTGVRSRSSAACSGMHEPLSSGETAPPGPLPQSRAPPTF